MAASSSGPCLNLRLPIVSYTAGERAFEASGVFTCSGRMPTAITRLRSRHGSVVRSRSRTIHGSRLVSGCRGHARRFVSDQRLHALREPGGEGTAALDFGKIVGADSAFAKGSCQYIGRRDGVLNGKIDPDAPTGDMA